MDKSLKHIEFKKADGHKATVGDYSGKVVLVVNVASQCGLTPQYKQLEQIFETYRDKGFTVLAFPANEFGAQEPGTDEEIQQFCKTNFGVQFPVMQKTVVKGPETHPLFKYLTTKLPEATKNQDDKLRQVLKEHGLLSGEPHEIMWNFEKFLINKKGEVVARFAPDVSPDDARLTKAIEIELTH